MEGEGRDSGTPRKKSSQASATMSISTATGAGRALPGRGLRCVREPLPRYYERLLRFCLRRLNDRHEAEDAAQEAFARAWKALPRFAGERRFYPWLTVIAGNICTDMLRRRSRSTRPTTWS